MGPQEASTFIVKVAGRAPRGGGTMNVTAAQITQRASKDGVSAKVVERDYALAHAVQAARTGRALDARAGPAVPTGKRGGALDEHLRHPRASRARFGLRA